MALNTEQQRAVDCEDHLLVLAPPGSGKTGTLVAKTKHIIESRADACVVMVTFTDASAKEAHERLSKQLRPAQMGRVRVATFHKHAMNQLRAAGKLGQIITPHQSSELVKQALRNIGSTMDAMEAESMIQAAKSTPDFTGKEEDFIAEYETLKKRHRSIDLQDLTRECVQGMRSNAGETHVPGLPATHVLCDEFQDVDWNQLHWLLCYFEAGAIVTVVGDDDQSVYGWRSSLGYDAMEAFITRTSPQVINLEINYRSRREILDSATCLVRNNSKRMAKNIVSAAGTGGRVMQAAAPTVADEAELVGQLVLEDVDDANAEKKRVPPGRWGIIGRTNRDLWLVSTELRKLGIPHHKASNKDCPPDVLLFCAFLVSLQTAETIGLRQMLGAIGISDVAAKAFHDAMEDNFFLLMDNEVPEVDGIAVEDLKALKDFCKECAKWRNLLRGERAQYKRVIDAVGYFFTEFIIRNDEVREDFMSFLEMLKKGKGALNERIRLFMKPEESKGAAGVSLLTMHGSKGLEFDRVCVVHCNSGNVPSKKTKSVEEERRLFYVAMTRARKDLYLSHIVTRGPSVFLNEIGPTGSVEMV